MARVIFTPSNLKSFMQCPAKFKAMYVDKTVQYQQSESAARGERLHELMERAIQSGWSAVDWVDDLSRPHAQAVASTMQHLRVCGWHIRTEMSVAISADGKALDFWDKSPDNFMRCRIDVMAIHPDSDTVLIFDHKTGKKYELDKLQLQFNAVCLVPVTHRTKYLVTFDYLDNGDVVTEELDVRKVNLHESDPVAFMLSPCAELLQAIDGAEAAFKRDDWPQHPNRFCKWCGVMTCPHAGK